jgi:hypothetical protein
MMNPIPVSETPGGARYFASPDCVWLVLGDDLVFHREPHGETWNESMSDLVTLLEMSAEPRWNVAEIAWAEGVQITALP